MFDYSDKVIVITGASSGLGRELCLEFARMKARVAFCGRSSERLEELHRALTALGCACTYAAFDLGSPEALKPFVEQVLAELGNIHVLVNNAGTCEKADFSQLSSSVGRREMEVNYLAPLRLTQEILPILSRNGEGQIINISSLVAFRPLPQLASYSASKAALAALTTSLRMELTRSGLDVIGVYPGRIDTPFHRGETKAQRGWKGLFGAGLPADLAARRIVAGARRRKSTIHTHWEGKLLFRANNLFPWFFDQLFSSTGGTQRAGPRALRQEPEESS